MLALRSGFTRALAARMLAPQVFSSFATGPRQNDGTIYEFRTYYLKPSKMNEFLQNFKKNVHLRTAHSELIGYWSVEFGGRMNKVFHIWKYDNFAHRTAVRKALAQDRAWQEQFLIPNLALIDKQESEITYLVPWCNIQKPPKEGVYELVTFQMKPGGPALWGDAFKRAIQTHVNCGYTKLVGVFHAEYGALNRVHVLWWNESADSRAAGRHQSHEDPRVVAAGSEEMSAVFCFLCHHIKTKYMCLHRQELRQKADRGLQGHVFFKYVPPCAWNPDHWAQALVIHLHQAKDFPRKFF